MLPSPLLAAIPYPSIDPVLISIGPIQVHWYGLSYVLGFLVAAWVMRVLNSRWSVGLTDDDIITAMLYCIVGAMLGGRLGYVIGYGGSSYWAEPISIFRVWDGGMAFHGALLGIVIAGVLFGRRVGVPFLRLADMAAVGTPVGLFLGRVANFINGELWGRTTDVPWAMVFPGAGAAPRHPSQLYEAGLEGMVLFAIMVMAARTKRDDGFVFGLFIMAYGIFRFAIEFLREPDAQLGFIIGATTMGQLLSVPLVVAGGWLIFRSTRHRA